MVGNGMSASISRQFIKRFAIKQVIDIYCATEGNANMGSYDINIMLIKYKILNISLHLSV